MPAFLPSSRITFSFPSSRLFVSLRAEKPGLPFSLSLSLSAKSSFLSLQLQLVVSPPSVGPPPVGSPFVRRQRLGGGGGRFLSAFVDVLDVLEFTSWVTQLLATGIAS